MSEPALIVRVSSNLADLRAQMVAVSTSIQATEATLQGLAIGAGKAGNALGMMVEKFSGAKVIADVLEMAEAVDRVGGVSVLTAREIREVGGAAAEARLKLMAMGQDVPPRIQALADAFHDVNNKTEAALPHTNNLRGSLSAFDGVLSSMGINLSGQIRGLNDLADASGKTVGQLGALATAGLVVGAGVAGWKIGRAISDFFDLDEAIGNATAALLGFGDVAAQEGAAKAELLARASKLAGFEVELLSTALAVTKDGLQEWASNAQISAASTAGWHAEIKKVRANGELQSLTADLESQNFSLQDLATRYHVSVEALQVFTRETKAAGDAQKAADDAIGKHNAKILSDLAHAVAARKEAAREQADAAKKEAADVFEVTKLWDEYYALRTSHGGTANEIAIAQIDRWAADLTAKMVKAGTDTKQFYEGLAALSAEKLAGIGIDWKLIGTTSIEALQETARNARATYNEMIFGSNHFTREALAEQLAKTREAELAARGMGKGYVDAFDAAEKAAAKLLAAQIELRMEERQRQLESRTLPTAFEVTSQNFQQAMQGMITSNGMNPSGAGSPYNLSEAMAFAKLGYSMNEIVAIFHRRASGATGPNPPPQGPRIPGFAGGVQNAPGGWAMVGERGPEMMNVPQGANIYPHGSGLDQASRDYVEWDRLNTLQAQLWRAAGGVVNAEQQKIIDLMQPLTPEGFGKIASTVRPIEINVAITVTGHMLGTQQALAQVVGDAVMKSLHDAGMRH